MKLREVFSSRRSMRAWRLTLPAVCAAILFAIAGCGSGGHGLSFAEHFDDDSIDAGLWTVEVVGSGPSIAEVNQQLEISVPGNSTGFSGSLRSKYVLKGDFDIQVDFHLIDWPTASGLRMGLLVGDDVTDDFMKVQRDSLSVAENPGEPREFYHATFKPHGGGAEDIGPVPTTASTGKLRIVRTSGVYSGYYWDATSNQWVFIKSGHNFTGDMTIRLRAWSDNNRFAGNTCKVAFDNFIVNNGQFVAP